MGRSTKGNNPVAQQPRQDGPKAEQQGVSAVLKSAPREVPAMPITSISEDEKADIAMGVVSHFYTEFWSGTFVLLLLVGAAALSSAVLRLVTGYRLHHQMEAQAGMATLVVVSAFFCVCFHRWRIMRLLRRRELDKRLLGEMAAITLSLSMLTFLLAPLAM